MHYHHHTLRKIADWIRREAKGALLGEVFSQEKDQVVIGLGSPEKDLYLRVACAAPLPYLWPMKQANKSKRNVFELFKPALGCMLVDVQAVPWERVLVLSFEGGYQIVLKMHGLSSNVLLLKDGAVVERFRQNMPEDLDFKPVPGKFDENWRETAEHGEGLPVLERLRMISPIFEKRFASRTEHWIDQGMSFAEAFEKVLAEAEDDHFYLLRDAKRMQFLLFPIEGAALQEFTDIATALDVFLRNWHQYEHYARQYGTIQKKLEKHLSRVQGQLQSAKTTIRKIQTERPPEEFGHLLMANLHALTAGMEVATLYDFYLDQPIELKLKKELNPQENAEVYYQKQKKHRTKVKHLESQIGNLEQEMMMWMELEEEFAAFPQPQDLPYTDHGIDPKPSREIAAFLKKHENRLKEGVGDAAEKAHPFYEYSYMGYLILAGKNAKQNDELTFKFARKTDIWLHARDAFGSHVIVRNPSDQDLPKPVLEYAASVAAKHSKRKHEGLVPVQYTPKKYIRKMKNGAPGQVIVEREKVLMIEPMPEN